MAAEVRALFGSRSISNETDRDRELLRAIRTANMCLHIQCTDQLGENCVCHAEFLEAKAAQEVGS